MITIVRSPRLPFPLPPAPKFSVVEDFHHLGFALTHCILGPFAVRQTGTAAKVVGSGPGNVYPIG